MSQIGPRGLVLVTSQIQNAGTKMMSSIIRCHNGFGTVALL